ncbi:uncharacterized protein [Gossypium hirsutum]|uniref:GAG-pre-integrase domain-containing protein n=1 Tax=Gossypium hirsutum TaxID=3635 RepID=A0ABM3A1F2_GOSHI|nr:uncharacterized protein LOC121217226 [Gossypium hirsutum]
MAVVNSIRLLGEHFDEARIVEKEQRRASRAEDHQEGAFNAKAREASSINAPRGKKPWKSRPKPDTARSNDQPCRHCKRPGHPEDRCWFRPDAICQHCKKKGHVERVCKNRTKSRQSQFQQPKVEARVAEDSSDQEKQVFAVSCLAAEKKCSKGWLLDSGCTNHMSPDASLFKTLDRSNKIIPNVLLVPEIDRNLLSIAQLLEKGYSVVFKNKQCHIADPSGSSLMTVTMTDKCFEVHWPNDSKFAYTASVDDSKLWHQRLGHANFRSLARMAKEGLAENFTSSVEHDDRQKQVAS